MNILLGLLNVIPVIETSASGCLISNLYSVVMTNKYDICIAWKWVTGRCGPFESRLLSETLLVQIIMCPLWLLAFRLTSGELDVWTESCQRPERDVRRYVWGRCGVKRGDSRQRSWWRWSRSFSQCAGTFSISAGLAFVTFFINFINRWAVVIRSSFPLIQLPHAHTHTHACLRSSHTWGLLSQMTHRIT